MSLRQLLANLRDAKHNSLLHSDILHELLDVVIKAIEPEVQTLETKIDTQIEQIIPAETRSVQAERPAAASLFPAEESAGESGAAAVYDPLTAGDAGARLGLQPIQAAEPSQG